jgi:hypothetical protein
VASKLDTGYYTQAYLTTHTDRGSSKSGIHNTDKIARPGHQVLFLEDIFGLLILILVFNQKLVEF